MVAVVVHLIGGDVLPEVKRGGGSGTAGVFPLGFGGQAQLQFGFHAVELVDEALRVVPTDIFYRKLCTFEVAGVVAHEDFPQGLGDGGFSNPEATGEGDLVLGFVTALRSGSSSGDPMRNVPGSHQRNRWRMPL